MSTVSIVCYELLGIVQGEPWNINRPFQCEPGNYIFGAVASNALMHQIHLDEFDASNSSQ